MKIAFFADNFYPELSGISDSIIETGEGLRKNGHDVLYVAARYAVRDYENVRDQVRDTLPTIRMPSIPLLDSPTGHSRVALPIASSTFALKRFRPDLLHVHSPYGTGLEALISSTFLHVPIVGTNHTMIEEFVRYAPLSGERMMHFARRYDAWFYNHCSFVSAPYQGLLDGMKEVGFKSSSRVVSNPVSLEEFSPVSLEEKESFKQKYGYKGKVILVAGRLAPEKRVDIVLRAFAAALQKGNELSLVITGDGSVRVDLIKLAHDLGIESHVYFPGFVHADDLAQIYKAVDIFVIMSVADSQSLALMQAYASGLPAITASARGLPSYTPESCGFSIPVDDVEMLQEKITLLANDDDLRTKLGKGGLEFVRRFAPEKIREEWELIYQEVIAGKKH